MQRKSGLLGGEEERRGNEGGVRGWMELWKEERSGERMRRVLL